MTEELIDGLVRVERIKQAHYTLKIGTVSLSHYGKARFANELRDEVRREIKTALGINIKQDELAT